MNLDAFLDDLVLRGVVITLKGDHVRVRAPMGALSQADRDALAGHAGPILARLEAIDPEADGRADGRVAPGPDAGPRSLPCRPAAAHEAPPVTMRSSHCPARKPGGESPAEPDEFRPSTPSPNPQNAQKGIARTSFAGCAVNACRPEAAGVDRPTTRLQPARPADRSVCLGGRDFAYSAWDGGILEGGTLALAVETPLSDGVAIPRLALVAASSGLEHVLIHPDRLAAFVRAHADRQFVCHNAAIGVAVVAAPRVGAGDGGGLRSGWVVVDEDRMHDTMILDALVGLARSDADPTPRDLAAVASEYAGLAPGESDSYRLRYGEMIDVNWSDVPAGFFRLAIASAIAIRAAYEAIPPLAVAFTRVDGRGAPGGTLPHGPLSEAIQVKGAIALERIGRTPLHIDIDRVDRILQALRGRQAECVAEIERLPGGGGIFRRDAAGNLILTEKAGTPSSDEARLREALGAAAAEVAEDLGRRIEVPRNASGGHSLKRVDWEDLAPSHPLIRSWLDFRKGNVTIIFFNNLRAPFVHPRYNALVRTGRTSCSEPNIQNLPRTGGIREAFVPSPGHVFMIADYGYVELCTLAAVLEARFGTSKLADVIRSGIDPHAYTAAMFEGMSFDDFMALKNSDQEHERSRFSGLRQRAKVLNFGIPGGLGPRSLVAYAWSTYKVDLTFEEATRFRNGLIDEVYPELGRYLDDDAMATLAANLGVPVESCWQRFDRSGDRSGAVAGGIRNVVLGKVRKADGQPYSPRYLDGVWGGLLSLTRDPQIAGHLARREGGNALAGRLFRGAVATLTGRVRGGVGYTQARNTPFQGLAADGAKLALYALIRAPVIGSSPTSMTSSSSSCPRRPTTRRRRRGSKRSSVARCDP